MKKIKGAQALVFTLLMAQPPAVLADYYRSSIDGINLGDANIYQPRSITIIKKEVCDQYLSGSQKDVDFYFNCSSGVDAAQAMAVKYAAGEGDYLGCVDGYQQGIKRGFFDRKDPSSDQRASARAMYAGSEIKEAKAAGERKAKNDSQFSSESEVIARFRDNLRVSANDTVQAPSDDYSDVLKVPSFEGFNNGYSTQGLGGSFSGPVNAGWVSSSSDIETRIRARAVYDTKYSLKELCSPAAVLFSPSLHTISFWDIFSAYGEYNFKDYGYQSTDRAWTKFSCDPNASSICEVLDESLVYRNIKAITERRLVQDGTVDDTSKPIYKYVQAKDPVTGEPVLNADGSPKLVLALDANGKPIVTGYEQKPNMVYRDIVVAGKSKKELQAKFKEGYRASYQYLVRDYFGKSFIPAHQRGRLAGEELGRQIGARVAGDIAVKEAYDAKYKLDSATAFAREYERLFIQDWNKNFDFFENNPVVELSGMEVIGKDNDDIYRRGEFIRPLLKLTNLGLKPGKITIALDGGINSSSAISDTTEVPASIRASYDTNKFLARINANARVRSTENIIARVSAPGTDSIIHLNDSASKTILINEIAEINGKREEIFTTKGEGTVFVDVVNPATVEAGTIDVEVNLDNGASFKASMILGKAEGGKPATKANFPVRLSGMDPLKLISDGGFKGTVSTKLPNGVELHSADIGIGIDKTQELAKYFHQVINGETLNFGNQSKEARTEALINGIITKTSQDIDNDIDWDIDSQVRRTLLGKLVNVKRSAMAAGNVTDAAQAIYDDLSKQLNEIYNRVGDYEGYLKLLNQLSSTELEERGKKDRK